MEKLVLEKHNGNILRAVEAGDIKADDAYRLQDRISARQREEAEAQAQQERWQKAIDQGFPGLETGTLSAIVEGLNELGAGIDLENPVTKSHLESKLKPQIENFKQIMTPVVFAPFQQRILNTLFSERYADYADVSRDQAMRMSPDDQVVALLKAHGQMIMASPAVQSKAVDDLKEAHSKEVEQLKADHLAEINDFRSKYGILDGTLDGKAGGAGHPPSYKTKAEARALHVAGKLSDAEMRRVRNDPGIPEGL